MTPVQPFVARKGAHTRAGHGVLASKSSVDDSPDGGGDRFLRFG